MKIKAFYDEPTFTLTYVAYDEQTRDAVVIDPVLDYDSAASSFSVKSVDELSDFLQGNELKLHYILETHAHADHLSGAHELKGRFPGAKLGIGEQITAVQEVFQGFFNLKELRTDGSQFDELFSHDQEIAAGSLRLKVIATPGHTPACVSYLVNEEAVFTGDAIFMPDFGTGRCDFPKGDARALYHSIHERLYALPDETKVFVGHDYQPGGRELAYESTVGEEKQKNIQLKAETTEDEFVSFRTERDAKLAAPKLLLPSVQFNIDAGNLPAAEDNGTMYLRIPFRPAK
jgi:glyoxylase-like metal-dependent hydrolase (beta-lactamase superfamily II)